MSVSLLMYLSIFLIFQPHEFVDVCWACNFDAVHIVALLKEYVDIWLKMITAEDITSQLNKNPCNQ